MPQPVAPPVDPVFAEIAKAIYGPDVDPRELLAKFSPGGSDLHVDGGDPKRQKVLAATGLASTGVAGVAGLHAIKATNVENLKRRADAGDAKAAAKLAAKKPGDAGKVVRAVSRVTRLSPVKAASVIGAGALGLHGVELLGDSLAANAQVKAYRDAAKKQQQDVTKAFRLRPLNPGGLKVPSLRAKRPKMTPLTGGPAAGGGLFQPVRKGIFGSVRRTVRNVERTSAHAAYAADQMTAAARNATEATGKINDLIPSKKTVRRVALGTGAGLGTLTYTGARAGAKSANKPDDDNVSKSVTWTGEISKIDAERRQVFGWASVSEIDGKPVVDLQGDIVPIEEIEKAAYTYVLESRKGGDMHDRVHKGLTTNFTEPRHTADMIESFVVTPEKLSKMNLPGDALPLGWWIGYKINDDEQWNLVKAGRRTGFSIHGKGVREPVDVSKKAALADELGQRRGMAGEQPGRHRLRVLTPVGGKHRASAETNNWDKIERRSRHTWVRVMPKHLAKAMPTSKTLRAVRRTELATQRLWNVNQHPSRTPSKELSAARNAMADRAKVAQGRAREAGHSAKEIAGVQHDATADSIRRALGPTRGAWNPHAPVRPVEKSLSDVKDKARKKLTEARDATARRARAAGDSLRNRTDQALHPPKVKLYSVDSTAVREMGYQRQTRRLAYQMHHGGADGKTYTYRVSPRSGMAAVDASSKGRHYATQVRGKAKRVDPDSVTPAGRARLFLNPVSKAIALAPQPPKKPVLKPLTASVGAKPAPPIAPMPKPIVPGGKVNMP